MKSSKGITLIVLIGIVVSILIVIGIIINLKDSDKLAERKVEEDIKKIRNDIALERESYHYADIIPEEYKNIISVAVDGNIIYIGDSSDIELKENLLKNGVIEVNTSSEDLLKIKALWDLATDYATDTSSIDTATELCLQYIRHSSGRYTTDTWASMAGAINLGFVEYVNNSGTLASNYDFSKITIIDDFVHMCGALNAYVYGEETTHLTYSVSPMLTLNANMHDAFCGWAGDMSTLIGQLVKEANNELIPATADELLGSTNPKSTFDLEDVIADLDALNIYKLGADNFYGAILTYYYAGGAESRVKLFKTFLPEEAPEFAYTSLSEFFASYIRENLSSVAGIIYDEFSGNIAFTFYYSPSSYVLAASKAFENWLENN